jgi:DNA-binding CsgD family transcriptional regulator
MKLTERERECLLLTGQGLQIRDIAVMLGISPNTAQVHVENIKRKLGAATKAHAVILALKYGELQLKDFRNELATLHE